jgi:hypothetical protein
MARASAVPTEEGGVSEIIRRAGDGMVLVITRAMWETLILQARAENLTPGLILDKALKGYLEEHGCQEAVDYLFLVAEGQKNERG